MTAWMKTRAQVGGPADAALAALKNERWPLTPRLFIGGSRAAVKSSNAVTRDDRAVLR